jgi:hypothetical protein
LKVNVIADAVLVEELVELLVIDAMRALHLAIKAWRTRADVDVPDVSRLEMPVELRLEFGAVVGLDHVYTERQPAHDLVDELHGRALGARVVDLQDANPGAIVDSRELIQAAPRTGDSLEKLDVQL